MRPTDRFIHQQTYIEKLLTKFGMSEASTPAEPHLSLDPAHGEIYQYIFPYREAVGSLMFLATVSRPDIAYSVNVCARYLVKFNDTYCQAVKRIMRYLKGTFDFGIVHRKGENNSDLVLGYGFCEWPRNRRSTSGYIFELTNNNMVLPATKNSSIKYHHGRIYCSQRSYEESRLTEITYIGHQRAQQLLTSIIRVQSN